MPLEVLTSRRGVITSAAALSLAACSRGPASGGGKVLAAGPPAAILIWALAPDRLLGWPRRPGTEALAYLPPSAGNLAEVGGVTGVGPQASLETIAAARPALALDYGDRSAAHQAQSDRIRRILNIDYALIDGALERMPEALLDTGRLLGVEDRAASLADRARAILDARPRSGPSFYHARGGDGLETGFRGALATEVLEDAGWTNVALGSGAVQADIGRVSREQVAAWDPEVVLTLDAGFADRAATDALWSRRQGGSRRRVVLLSETPFGWLDRPPSINRLLGCLWLGSRDPFGPPDPALATAVAAFHEQFYGLRPTPTQTLALLPRVMG